MTSSGQRSLLDVLKPASKSDLSRKRRVEKLKTVVLATANTTDPKSISPADRLKEFPGECLEVRHRIV